MLKQYPPFVASLHVTVRIEPLSREIDVDAAFEKLTSGLEQGALEAVRGTCWKGYSITIDKVPPAPEGVAAPKVHLDPPANLHRGICKAITAELVRQGQEPLTNFALPALLHPENALTSSVLTVDGRLDIEALAKAICTALEA